MNARLAALIVLLLLAGAPLADDYVVEVVPLKHRLVNDVLPALRELVEPGGTVTGLNNQLIIRSTPDNLAQLKQVLATLDTRQRQLRITVRQGIAANDQLQRNELAARVGAGDVAAAIAVPGPGPLAGPGAGIVVGDDDNQIAYRNYRTQGSDDSANTHFVTAIEGSPAFISAGQIVPLPRQTAVLTPYGASIQESLDYQDVAAGFYVTPQVSGDTVRLEIAPFADKLDSRGGGQIAQHGLSTAASGRLGEWIPLGGAAESYNQTDGGITHSTRRQGSDSYDVWVKVDILP